MRVVGRYLCSCHYLLAYSLLLIGLNSPNCHCHYYISGRSVNKQGIHVCMCAYASVCSGVHICVWINFGDLQLLERSSYKKKKLLSNPIIIVH